MQRLVQAPRADWPARLEADGFRFHSIDGSGRPQADAGGFRYWREDVAYRFTEVQVETLYAAACELNRMCLDLAADLVRAGDLSALGLPDPAQALIERSWRAGEPSLYGRFDLAWTGQGPPKLLEYNADTPTSILETAVAQWRWKESVQPAADQFNSLHEALVERWRAIAVAAGIRHVHFAGLYASLEDVGNLEYLLDTALQAGLDGELIDMTEIGLSADGAFLDLAGRPIEACFKLYPWEWMVREQYAQALLADRTTRWIEPAWKMLLSNKALLPLLWQRHRGHPNLLPASFRQADVAHVPHLSKPRLSREGANVTIWDGGAPVFATPGDYAGEGLVWQALAPLAMFPQAGGATVYAVAGAWIVGDEAVGLGIREDTSPVTGNDAWFVPHYFE